jgi:hypothetical protein
MSDNLIEERKTELDKLLTECESHLEALTEFKWRMNRLEETSKKAATNLQEFMALVKKRGQADELAMAIALLQRVQKIGLQLQQARTMGAVNSVV